MNDIIARLSEAFGVEYDAVILLSHAMFRIDISEEEIWFIGLLDTISLSKH